MERWNPHRGYRHRRHPSAKKSAVTRGASPYRSPLPLPPPCTVHHRPALPSPEPPHPASSRLIPRPEQPSTPPRPTSLVRNGVLAAAAISAAAAVAVVAARRRRRSGESSSLGRGGDAGTGMRWSGIGGGGMRRGGVARGWAGQGDSSRSIFSFPNTLAV